MVAITLAAISSAADMVTGHSIAWNKHDLITGITRVPRQAGREGGTLGGDHPWRVTRVNGGNASVTAKRQGIPGRSPYDREEPIMTMPKAEIDSATRDALAGLAVGDLEVLEDLLEIREAEQQKTGLDARTFALVKIAALVALDAPPASYLWQIANALDAGATPADLIGVLRAVAPQVGGPRVVAAAPEIMVALGLALPEGQ